MKVYFRTYGCRANQYDTESARSMLIAAGIVEVERPDDADVAVFNSCTVTASAEADLRADVRAARRGNSKLRTIVMGCAAAVPDRDESRAPLATLPGVEAIVPAADLSLLASKLGIASGASAVRPGQTGARALLRIQDGCDEHCTFCATTISRGASRSRPARDLVEEAGQLAATHPEIVLTGIHIGTYGRDSGSSLGQLVEQLVVEVPRVRFRLSSVEATEVDDRLSDFLCGEPRRVAPHLHAPLQSGSDAVLKRMGRRWYTAGSYRAAVERLLKRAGTFALSADVITGFPGETESDYLKTFELVEELPFTALHVFPYSPRPGTAAVRLGAPVEGATVRRRSKELRDIAAAKAVAYRSRRVGGRSDVVVIERGKGLTEDYLSVAISDRSIPRRSRFDAYLTEQDSLLTAQACS